MSSRLDRTDRQKDRFGLLRRDVLAFRGPRPNTREVAEAASMSSTAIATCSILRILSMAHD